jgi:hypothetical protein
MTASRSSKELCVFAIPQMADAGCFHEERQNQLPRLDSNQQPSG